MITTIKFNQIKKKGQSCEGINCRRPWITQGGITSWSNLPKYYPDVKKKLCPDCYNRIKK